MVKKLLGILFLVATLSGCLKNPGTTMGSTCTYQKSTLVAPASEVTYLQNYLSSRNIVAQKDSSGIFYSIDSVGKGLITPDVCSYIGVTYYGKFLLADNSNPTFDSNTAGTGFYLGGVILGWQKGIPLIRVGGSITLYIPPSLAYGVNGSGSIPPNSYLKFSVQLLGIQ